MEHATTRFLPSRHEVLGFVAVGVAITAVIEWLATRGHWLESWAYIATVTLRRYRPGTATAVPFNLPLGCLFLARALSEDFIELEVFVWSAPLVALAIVASIPVLFAVGRKIQVE